MVLSKMLERWVRVRDRAHAPPEWIKLATNAGLCGKARTIARARSRTRTAAAGHAGNRCSGGGGAMLAQPRVRDCARANTQRQFLKLGSSMLCVFVCVATAPGVWGQASADGPTDMGEGGIARIRPGDEEAPIWRAIRSRCAGAHLGRGVRTGTGGGGRMGTTGADRPPVVNNIQHRGIRDNCIARQGARAGEDRRQWRCGAVERVEGPKHCPNKKHVDFARGECTWV